jgi:cell division protein FtsB
MQEREPPIWIAPFSLLVIAIVLLSVKIFEEEGLPRYRALRAERETMETRNERVRERVRELRREVRALREDPHAIERVARDELGLIRRGEFVFQFDGREIASRR